MTVLLLPTTPPPPGCIASPRGAQGVGHACVRDHGCEASAAWNTRMFLYLVLAKMSVWFETKAQPVAMAASTYSMPLDVYVLFHRSGCTGSDPSCW